MKSLTEALHAEVRAAENDPYRGAIAAQQARRPEPRRSICAVCGVVIGDAEIHRVWHFTPEQRSAEALARQIESAVVQNPADLAEIDHNRQCRAKAQDVRSAAGV